MRPAITTSAATSPSAGTALHRQTATQRGYNATIIDIHDPGNGTRVFRVEPDEPISGYAPGRYISLGRGHLEPRYDGLALDVPEAKRHRVLSRPYSLSSTLVSDGRVHEPGPRQTLEFYIALVTPGPGQPPAQLTPKLWATRPGDRVQLGKRITGRYTLDPIDDLDADILFLATGTGEAPHNAMVNELARRGHRGRVTVLSTSRRRCDFTYLAQHWTLERLWPGYTYIPLPTRDPYDGVKRRIQDILRHRDRATLLGFEPDPDRTHVFLCGNPAMVAPPEWVDDTPVFDTSGGAIELLHHMGFTLDRKGHPHGNVHFEAFW